MKNKTPGLSQFHKLAIGFVCSLLALSSYAENLTVARGETFTVSGEVSYDVINVSGTINIPDGAKVEVKTMNLGPNAGDNAVVNVLGTNEKMLDVSEKLYIGGVDGGSGKIVALVDGATAGVQVIRFGNVIINENAAASANGTIDFLEMGNVTSKKIVAWENKSTIPARIRVRGGQLGYDQNFSGIYFTGPFVIEGYEETSDVTIANTWTGNNWTLNSDSLLFSTRGKVIIDYSSSWDPHVVSVNKGIAWDGIEELVLKGKAVISCNADNVLPFGKNCGGIRAEGNTTGINLKNRSVKLNSFTVALNRSASAMPAIDGTDHSKIIFGTEDVDGTFFGVAATPVIIEKVGTGTLDIPNATSCGTMKVSQGTLRVSGAFNVETLILEEDAKLIIDGVRIAPSVRVALHGEVVCLNGGSICEETTIFYDEDTRLESFDATGLLTKNGTGLCVLAGSQSIAREIHVKEGSLGFAGGGYNAKLFRFNFTNWTKIGYTENWSNGQFLLDEIAFIDKNSMRVGKGIRTAEAGTAPENLNPGEAVFAAGTEGSSTTFLFDSKDYPRVKVTSPLVTDPGGVTLYVRLPDDASPVVAWNLAAGFGGLPTAWTLSASLDNASTWETLHSETAFTASDSNSMSWLDGKNLGDTVPMKFPLFTMNPDFMADCEEGMPAAVRVRVDENATIDFSNVNGGQTIDGLTIDVSAGGGKIINGIFAQDGTINIISDTGVYSSGEVAFDFDNSQNVSNLNNWSVTCNGFPVDSSAVVFDEANSKFVCTINTIALDESGSGNALNQTSGLNIVKVAANVSYVNSAPLSGSGSFMKIGPGTLSLEGASSTFTGDFSVLEGIVKAPVSGTFGTGVVNIRGSKTTDAQVVLGSETEATVYDNSFVLSESSSEEHPAIFFVTKGLKSITLNGTFTANGDLYMNDSAKGTESQMKELVTFNGSVNAQGRMISYPTDNKTTWNAPVTALVLRGWSPDYHRMGRHVLESAENKIGSVEVGFVCADLKDGSLNGAGIRLVGNNNELIRGSIYVFGDQTAAWIDQEKREYAKKYEPKTASTLTITGGVSFAQARLNILDDVSGTNGKTSLVIDSGNDDFVQVFSDATWTASGNVTVSNGTLRLSGEFSAPQIENLFVEGGVLEIDTTLGEAFASVTNITIGANGKLSLSPGATDAFSPKVVLTMAEGAMLELPEGATMNVHHGTFDGKKMSYGNFTGAEGTGSGKTQKSWIVGGGVLTVKTGSGFAVIVR